MTACHCSAFLVGFASPSPYDHFLSLRYKPVIMLWDVLRIFLPFSAGKTQKPHCRISNFSATKDETRTKPQSQAVVAYAFDPITWEAETEAGSLSSYYRGMSSRAANVKQRNTCLEKRKEESLGTTAVDQEEAWLTRRQGGGTRCWALAAEQSTRKALYSECGQCHHTQNGKTGTVKAKGCPALVPQLYSNQA